MLFVFIKTSKRDIFDAIFLENIFLKSVSGNDMKNENWRNLAIPYLTSALDMLSLKISVIVF